MQQQQHQQQHSDDENSHGVVALSSDSEQEWDDFRLHSLASLCLEPTALNRAFSMGAQQPFSTDIDLDKVTVMADREKPSFVEVKPETDLRTPPPHWLQYESLHLVGGRQAAQQDLRDLTAQELHSSELAEFGDIGSDIDFIAPADNLKALMRLPYSRSSVSLTVHRVGQSLILDGMLSDEQRTRSRFAFAQADPAPQSTPQTEQEEQPKPKPKSKERQRRSVTKKKNKAKQMNRELYSKFLFYSVTNPDDPTVLAKEKELSGSLVMAKQDTPTTIEPNPEIDCNTGSHSFRRVLHWQFQDLNMLLGSDLLICSNEAHPSISLHLRDMDREITMLTCVDYWLENFINNVPETAVCFHKEGRVQGYQLVKTEDIPKLSSIEFEPKVIVQHAASILHFLQSHCSQEAGTYWLTKEENSNVIRLYEISPKSRHSAAPFSFPVGMLCYRIASKLSDSRQAVDVERHRRLMAKCVELLDQPPGSEKQSSKAVLVSAAACEQLGNSFAQSWETPLPTAATELWTPKPTADDVSVPTSAANATPVSNPTPQQIIDADVAIHHYQRALAILDRATIELPATALSCRKRCVKALGDVLLAVATFRFEEHLYLGTVLSLLRTASQLILTETPKAHEAQLLGQVFMLAADVWAALPATVPASATDVTLLFAESDKSQEAAEQVPVVMDPLTGVNKSERPWFVALPKPIVNKNDCYGTAIRYYLKSLGFHSPPEQQSCVASKLGRCFSSQGCLFVSTGRYTKAYQHWRQGLELFRSLSGPSAQQHVVLIKLSLAILTRTRSLPHSESCFLPLGTDRHEGSSVIMAPDQVLDHRRAIDILKEADTLLQASQMTAEITAVIRDRLQSELAITFLSLGWGLQQRLLAGPDFALGGDVDGETEVLQMLSNAGTSFAAVGQVEQAAVTNFWTAHLHMESCLAATQALTQASQAGEADSDVQRRVKVKEHLATTHFNKAASVLTAQTHPYDFCVIQLRMVTLLTHSTSRAKSSSLEMALARLISLADAYSAPNLRPPLLRVSPHPCLVSHRTSASVGDLPSIPGVPVDIEVPPLPAAIEQHLHSVLKALVKVLSTSKASGPRLEHIKGLYRVALEGVHTGISSTLRRLADSYEPVT